MKAKVADPMTGNHVTIPLPVDHIARVARKPSLWNIHVVIEWGRLSHWLRSTTKPSGAMKIFHPITAFRYEFYGLQTLQAL